ncbi:MAG TPA: hypothetical protein PK339_06925 [Flavitalea sp.]|nr:hypothetical protein [Flavitalea sp.]
MNNENKELIELVKLELAAYLRIAEKLNFPAAEVEKQVNMYLEEIYELLKPKSN